MKRVFIIHGYGGYPDKNWFPWLKSELEKLGVSVYVPAMPDSDNPQLSKWLPYLQSHVGIPDENTYFVGHSLGCVIILRYIESLSNNTKIGGAVLVAGFASPVHFHELDNFFQPPFNDKKIKINARKIVAISSDNDPHIPYKQAEELKKRFNAELIKIHKGGHLNKKAGYDQLPLIVEKLKKLMAY